MRKRCNLSPGDAWAVDRIVEVSAGLPVEDVPLARVTDVDSTYWFDGRGEMPTMGDVNNHARLLARSTCRTPSSSLRTVE
jgi:hypothetical protein